MDDLGVDTVLGWRGHTVRDRQGEKLGKLGDLYLDTDDRPAYAGISTGLFGTRESIVPLAGVREEGGDLHVPFDAELVRDAPNIEPDAVLSPDEEDALARHYGAQTARDLGTDDGSMIRSEETATIEQGPMEPRERVRLRKVLVTENVEKTVPLRREVIQLETDPPPAGTIESTEDLDGRPEDVGERRLDDRERPLHDGERPLDEGAPPERR
jgi:hypothetical protein